MFERLADPVEVEDIIMVFPSRVEIQGADLWIVRSCPDGNPPCPRTDSIMVSKGLYARSRTIGRWSLFGPEVSYESDDYLAEEYRESRDVISLKDVLRPLAAIYRYYDNIRVTVNPHGRDVFRDCFLKLCPVCLNDFWNPENQEHDELFPGLLTLNGVNMDQACPVCMGFDVALEDVNYVEELGALKVKIWGEPDPETYEELRTKFLDMVRERYTIQNKRKREMGLPLWDIDDRVRRYRRGYVEDKKAPANSSTEDEDEDEGEDEDEDDDYGEDDGDGSDGEGQGENE